MNLTGIVFDGNKAMVDVKTLVNEPDFSIHNLTKMRDNHLVNIASTLMDLNSRPEFDISFSNDESEPLTIDNAPDTMTIKEIKAHNAANNVYAKVKEELISALNSSIMLSDEQYAIILKKEYPDFTDTDVKNILAMEYDLIDSYGNEKIQNVDSLASLVAATKKQNYVFD